MGTFKQLATSQRFIGLSTEVKTTSGVNYGAEWYEVNAVTNKIDKVYTYVPDDGTGSAGWVETAGLNFDANLQIGSTDVSNANPVPVSDAGGSLTVDVGTALPAGSAIVGKVGIDQTTDGTTNKVAATQATHDSLNANANIQVGDADVSSTNPVPISPILGNIIARAVISAASAGDNTLVAAVADKKTKVLGLILIASGDVDVRLESGAGGTALTGVISLAADGNGFVLPMTTPGLHWVETGVNTLLNLELSDAVQVSGCLVYYQEA